MATISDRGVNAPDLGHAAPTLGLPEPDTGVDSTPSVPDEIRIGFAANGWLVYAPNVTQPTVFEVNEDSDTGEVEAGARLLYHLLELLGLYGSKHDAARLRVTVVRRDD